jgi:hypothetical protein
MSDLPAANHIQLDPNFVDDGVAELPQFLQTKQNYEKLARWYCTRWEIMDGEVIKLAYLRQLNNASGEILDMLGERIGLLRYDQTDTEYKALIKLRSFRQTTGASRADIVTLMKILFFGENPLITKRRSPLIIKVTNTTTVLDIFPYIHDAGDVKQTWIKPDGVGLGEYIFSVVGNTLTTSLNGATPHNTYTMTLVDGVPDSNNFMEVVIPANCLSDKDVSQQLEEMFPINTNLWVAQTDATPFYLVDLKDIIDSTNTATLLDNYTLIQDLAGQRKTWTKPEGVGLGEYITSVTNDELTTTGGVYQMTEFSNGLSDEKESSVEGLLTNWIHSSAKTVKNT